MEGSPVENPANPAKELDAILADISRQSINDGSFLPTEASHPSLFGHSAQAPTLENGYQPNFSTEHGSESNNSNNNGASSSSSVYSTPPLYSSFSPPQDLVNNTGSTITQASLTNMDRGSVQQHQIQYQNAPPFLVIVEQPAERCRFRYKAEQGPHGSLRSACGKKYKSCPKVKLENVPSNFGNLSVLAVLYTNEPNPRPHVNDLWGSHCKDGFCTVDVDSNMIATFPNLGIMRQKEKDVCDVLFEKFVKESQTRSRELTDDLRENLKEKAVKEHVTMKDCLHSVRIGFQGMMTNLATGQQLATPMVLSDPVVNSQNPGFSELRIAEIDKSHGSVFGGDTIWMRCAAKVRRDSIKIKFSEPSTGWESEGVFSANEVYEQILIIFKTPAYRDTNIRERVHVNLHLFRASDGEYSPPIDFVYMPLDDGTPSKTPAQLERKTELSEEFSLSDLKSIANEPEPIKKLEKILTHLWERHLQALWLFSSEGDPQSFVGACSQLIGWQDEDGTTALHISVRNQQSFALKTLLTVLQSLPQKASVLNSTNFRKQTPLHQAIRFTDADCVHYLITSGAERTLVDADGNSAAHYLSDTFNEAIYKDVLFPPKDTVAAKQQLDLGLLNNAGQSPLHLAVGCMKMILVESLVEAKAPLNVKERNSGKTPLYMAVQNSDQDTTELLLQSSADVNVQALDGSTALHLAVKNKHEPIIVKLIRAGADPDAKTAQWRLEDDVESMDSEEILGSGTQLVSARDVAEGDERLLRLLNGEVLDNLTQPTNRLSVPAISSRPNSSAEDDEDDGLESMAVGGAPSDSRIATTAPHMIERQRSPELPTAAMQDDLGSLDFITRLRLSKILDREGKWQVLAKTLCCEHMIDLIEVVCGSSEETSSPTIVFLDQYEQVSGATVSSLLASLERIKEEEAVKLILDRQNSGNYDRQSSANNDEMDAE